MADILDEAQSVVQCKTCPWYKNCVLPVRVSEMDLRKQLGSNGIISGSPGADGMGIDQLLSGLAHAAENSMLEGCPVFIERLRSYPNLAIRVKKMMQEWSEGQEEPKP